jgi:hypothetical protein
MLKYRIPKPYVNPPIPHNIPIVKVMTKILNEVTPIISENLGTVNHAKNGETINQVNKPPTIQ